MPALPKGFLGQCPRKSHRSSSSTGKNSKSSYARMGPRKPDNAVLPALRWLRRSVNRLRLRRLFPPPSRDCSNYLRLPQGGCLFVAAFELEHHPFDVLVVLVRLQELQTLLRIAPLQDLNALLTRAPRIHLALIRHIEVDRIAPGERPAVIFHAINLPGGKQTKDCACGPARPIRRR